MNKLNRRDFLKIAGISGAAATLGSSLPLSIFKEKKLKDLGTLLEEEYPFPYDSECFEASERVVFNGPKEISINILPKEGKTLDFKLYYSGQYNKSKLNSNLLTFYGVNDSLEIPIREHFQNPEFHYQIEYRESGIQSWKAIPKRVVKTPLVNLRERDIEVILIGDDHTPDDSDMGNNVLIDHDLREMRLNGDYINLFLKKLMKKPEYTPEKGTELSKLMNGFCLASTIRQIMANENPDFIINLGDHRGGFAHKWKALGLKRQHEATKADLDLYSKIFRIGTRKIFSALSPEIPIYWVLGNHDGESGYIPTQEPATKYRKKFFKLPGIWDQGSPDENYYPIIWGRQMDNTGKQIDNQDRILFIVLDNQRYNPETPRHPKDWTLGEVQKEWFKKTLEYEANWKFVLHHHVIGGWPAGPSEWEKDIAYGRGPLFTYGEYAQFCEDPNLVEQVELTRLMKENNVNIVFYGHDHIFNVKEIGNEFNGQNMYGICVGSTKHIGERGWYKGDFWRKFYGDFGCYWGKCEEADFWGPSGYTKLTIKKDGLKVEYIRGANNHPHTNVPQYLKVGDAISTFLL